MLKIILLAAFFTAVLEAQGSASCDPNCTNCLPDTGQCLACNTTSLYYLQNNACVLFSGANCSQISTNGTCTGCSGTTVLVSGVCLAVVPNCGVYNATSGHCQSCLTGFNAVSNGTGGISCVNTTLNPVTNGTTIPNCVTQTNDVCSGCLSGWVPSFLGNSCLPLIANCLVPNSYVNECIYCNYTYTNTSDHRACLPATPHCQVYAPSTVNSTSLVCSTCRPYYLLTNSRQCRLRYSNCLVADSLTGRCLFCFPGSVRTTDGEVCLPAVAQCLTYFDSRQTQSILLCRICNSGFDVSSDFTKCVPEIRNCLIYSNATSASGGSLCSVCLIGYRLSVGQDVCTSTSVSIPNCQPGASSNGVCTACLSGYILWLNGTVCLSGPSNCATYTLDSVQSTLRCLTCPANLTLSSNGTCDHVITNCETIANGVCTECHPNYSLSTDGLSCSPRIANCVQFGTNATSPTSSVCLVCATGYQLYQGACVYYDQRCAQFVNGKCSLCETGWAIATNQVNCLKQINLCRLYVFASYATTQLRCQLCQTGYTTTTDGLACLPLISQCSAYTSSSVNTTALTCTRCTAVYYLSNGICKANASINCLVFNSATGTCSQCITDYTLTSDSLKCLPLIPFCVIFNGSSNSDTALVCNTCSSGFQLTDEGGACLLSIPNCVTYANASANDTALTCGTCQTGYFATPQGTACFFKTITFCTNINTTSGECTTCQSGYVLTTDRQQCLPFILNCNAYALSNLTTVVLECTNCTAGSQLTGGICFNGTVQYCSSTSNNGTCIQCIAGYILTSDSRRCLAGISHCSRYAASNITDSILVCAACEELYWLTPVNSCAVNVTGCLTYHPALFICIACGSGLVPTSDGVQCLIAIDHCITYAASGISDGQLSCLECAPAFIPTPDAYFCVAKVIESCATMDNSTGLCIQCAPNFRATDDLSQCLPVITSCLIYQPSDVFSIVFQCAECQPGYDLRLNTCRFKVIANCVTRNNVTGLCSQCTGGNRLTDDNLACLPSIVNCVLFGPSTSSSTQFTCLVCTTHYLAINSNSLCVPRIPFCVYYEPTYGYCLYCDLNYQRTSDYELCLPTIPNCQVFEQSFGSSTSLACQTCATNFTLGDGALTCVVTNAPPAPLTCDPGWILTGDNLKCLPAISGCIIYQSTTVMSMYNICLQCDSSSFVTHNGDECLLSNRPR